MPGGRTALCGEEGRTEEAARRERALVRLDLEVIRLALATTDAHVAAGRFGTTVHYARGAMLSSPEPFERMATAVALVALGLPLIDTRPAPDPWAIVRLPMVAVGEAPDGSPWHDTLGRAPLAVYAARARALGARVVNLAPRGEEAASEGWVRGAMGWHGSIDPRRRSPVPSPATRAPPREPGRRPLRRGPAAPPLSHPAVPAPPGRGEGRLRVGCAAAEPREIDTGDPHDRQDHYEDHRRRLQGGQS